jgi:hypothetical protein
MITLPILLRARSFDEPGAGMLHVGFGEGGVGRETGGPTLMAKTMRIVAAVTLTLLAVVSAAAATSKIYSLQFFNRMDDLPARMPNVAALGEYTKKLNETVGSFLDLSGEKRPALASIVIAISPDEETRAWVFGFGGILDEQKTAKLTSLLEAVRPPSVFWSPVAFSVHLTLWDAPTPKTEDPAVGPFPDDWKEAAKAAGHSIRIPDDLPGTIWKKTPKPPLQTPAMSTPVAGAPVAPPHSAVGR